MARGCVGPQPRWTNWSGVVLRRMGSTHCFNIMYWLLLLFSCSVVSDSLWLHGLQHARLPCSSLSISQSLLKLMPIVSMMLCNHLIICHPFFSCPQSFPASGSFLVSWLFASGGQSNGASALASVLPVKYSGFISFRIDWFVLLAVQGTQESSPAAQFENISSSVLSLLYGPSLASVHGYWKNHNFD